VSDTSKRSRDQAESIFSKTQTQAMSLNRILSEQDAASREREAKTARLRELRLEKEAEELAVAAAVAKPAAPKRIGKR
jgi:predicted HicB family RNase H-like nuclease